MGCEASVPSAPSASRGHARLGRQLGRPWGCLEVKPEAPARSSAPRPTISCLDAGDSSLLWV